MEIFLGKPNQAVVEWCKKNYPVGPTGFTGDLRSPTKIYLTGPVNGGETLTLNYSGAPENLNGGYYREWNCDTDELNIFANTTPDDASSYDKVTGIHISVCDANNGHPKFIKEISLSEFNGLTWTDGTWTVTCK